MKALSKNPQAIVMTNFELAFLRSNSSMMNCSLSQFSNLSAWRLGIVYWPREGGAGTGTADAEYDGAAPNLVYEKSGCAT